MEYFRPTYTPERITNLRANEIFVFGSNLQGMHGGGAARMAYEKFGAIWGKGVGLQGQCYAIPTMQGGVDTIRPYVEEFVAFAKEHKELTFLVTPIGCGIAGFKAEDIAPLFKEAIVEENIVLPESFEEVIMQSRPLSKAAIDVLAKRMQAKNPYSAGTLSHGIWEHQHYFELLCGSYDHYDWREHFEKYGLCEDFERGVVLTDDLMHQPVNKEWVFGMYMSAEFPPQKLMLLEQCHYYKGERLCPFRSQMKGMLFNYERCWVKFNLFPQDHPHIEEDLDYYKHCGLADLCPNDGVPMSMKALLLNRWLHWGGDFANLDSFREWYRTLDYTNVNGRLRKEDLYDISNPDFLFFWGHHGKPGETTKACLSQWFPCRFTVNGIHYNCAEQFMMAEKARIMGDEDTRKRILASTDPKEIKALGREVRNFDEYKWQKHRMEIVITGNLHKFMDNEELKVFLLGTRDKILVEASPYDTVWGIGMKEDDPDCRNPRLWKGENLLGFALMDVREKLNKIK